MPECNGGSEYPAMHVEKNDKPLIGVLAVCVAMVVVFFALPRQAHPLAAGADTGAAAITQPDTAPANYNAPELPATTGTPTPRDVGIVDIVRDPTDLPAPV